MSVLADAATTIPDRPLTKSQVVHLIRTGQLTLAQLARDRPAALVGTTLFALVLTLPGFGKQRLCVLNRCAVADDINLASTLGGASGRTLAWLLYHVCGQVAISGDDAEPGAVHVGEPDTTERTWESVASALDALILDHQRNVRDESLPAERWAMADDRMHRTHRQIMANAPLRERGAA